MLQNERKLLASRTAEWEATVTSSAYVVFGGVALLFAMFGLIAVLSSRDYRSVSAEAWTRRVQVKLGDEIAFALRNAADRQQLEELLEETQRQAEELQAQGEELRVSNEELEQQSRALQASQTQLENQQAELEQINAQLEEQAQSLGEQRDELGAHRRRAPALERVQVAVPREHVARAADTAQQLADPRAAARRQSRRQPQHRAGPVRRDESTRRATTCSRSSTTSSISRRSRPACSTAANGQEALAVLDSAQPPPDVVIFDLIMPISTATACIARCRRTRSCREFRCWSRRPIRRTRRAGSSC